MSSENDYCVIGLGKFGMSVVRTLEELGKVCLAIDKNEERVQLAANIASEVLILDSTNRNALEDAGIYKIKNIIIAVGSDLAASVVTAVQILNLQKEYNDGTEINIVAKAVDSTHQLLLQAIGINNIILPEIEAGRRAAYRAIWKLGLDLTTVDEKHSIVNVTVKNIRLTNKKLETLKIPNTYNINLIAIKRDNKVIIPRSDERLFLNDEVLFIGKNDNISRVYNDFNLNIGPSTIIKEKAQKVKKKIKKRKKSLFKKKKR
ncbi:potassium channel family protein [Spiroplasma platyhelix]|uniref:TrkA family potassium uptake protein n=1 Tax=Spiroplasma platyhelix PALS-1 TaxID=1276218 RepID=A0A846TVG6_9MOLU|nr:TrkA family potassium uptake protein [Spiroplasma platyhelix]MBE4703769.1 Ktr system potassium uptake protein A [Spiroplasma platyhelix PALS-1]NKE38142.1 TrkA family potassium uptake protein [Spiroplasma platyhelix PALS-1]UJB29027.1 potassium uptake protein KtrA [Spiroplasma platyhelix PALS-1]